VTYVAGEIAYTTGDAASTETFKLDFEPADVTVDGVVLPRRTDLAGPGWTYDPVNRTVRLRHVEGNAVRISARAAGPDTLAPVIRSVAVSGATHATAAVSWMTNEPADSQIEYGVTTAYGLTTALNPARTTSHAIVLSGLSATTLYHYRVVSRDAAGNRAVSSDSTFATTIVDAAPPVVHVTAPVGGAEVSGASVAIEVAASDDVGVVSVQVLVDGAAVGGLRTAAPYSVAWDSTTVANGAHVITARAVDAAGRSTDSPAIAVTVNNPPQVVSFNELSGVGGPLGGEYPAGVVDWGSDAWLLSGPFGQLTTNSISLTESATSGSLRFVTPRRLLSVVAFNGGGGTSTVTLSCAGNPDVTVSVAPNEMLTIESAWTANCSTVTIGSSNGWDTNFDDLTFDLVR
jgi:hypothetical protein